MSRFLDKATQKVKKKVGQAVDRLRPSSRGTSPAPSQQSVHATALAPGIDTQSSEMTAAMDVAQTSVAISPSQPWTGHSATDASSLPLEPVPLAIPAYARPPSPPTLLSTTGSAIKGLLVAARDGSDLFLPLKAALVGVVALWDIFDRTVEAKAEFTKLESRLSAFKTIADTRQHEPCDINQGLQNRLISITQAVQTLWEAVEERQARGIVTRVAQSTIDLGHIKALVDAISSLLEVFQFESSIAVEQRLGLIVERLDADKNERLTKERAKKREKIMKAIKFALGDNFVSEAADDEQPSYAGCMAGTRVDVLSKFVEWVKTDPMSIFWLAGMAGTGKTSIAVSLCRVLRNDQAVLFGGGYFCSRSAGSIARTDVRRILPTLAALLAGQSQEFAEALAVELEKDHRVGHKPVAEQIDPILRQPLAALAPLSSRPLVFIIDGLDECSNERELAELLRLLADLESDTQVKFILISRPELHIRGTPISNPAHNTILQLHTISAGEVTSDVRLYIGRTLQDASPDGTWYTDRDIGTLVALCGGLFIFASTVLLYVLDPDDDEDRQDRLHRVTSTVATCTAAVTVVDKVYELVLSEASRPDTVDSVELDRMKCILACILMARLPLSVEALAKLIEIKPGRLRASLRRLHSLVHLPDNDEEPGLRTLHASFADYIHDRAPQHLKITPTLGHDILARGCLRRFAQDDLRFNISRSPSSFEPNPDPTPGLIPLSLIYACLQWAHHIDAASNRSAFDEEIGQTFRPKFLFWLEALSVMSKARLASGLLRVAGSAVTTSVISQFLRDANAFVASSHAAIERSAPHIYVSALSFAGKNSLVHQDFSPLYSSGVSVTTASMDRPADHLLMTLRGHEDRVNSVVYSPDGHLLASGSSDATVRIWDTRTGGETVLPMRSGNAAVLSVAFAPNGRRVASGTADDLVHIWSVSTGRAALHPLRGHSGPVSSVVFSQNGVHIASASRDGTVRLWRAETGDEVATGRKSHMSEINAIAFSPDSQLLASASHNSTVRLWVSTTGEAIRDILAVGCENDVFLSIAFSPDGKYLSAGGNNTSKVIVWDLGTPEADPGVMATNSSVMSLAFSPDGSRLVSAGWHNIQSWEPRSGRELPSMSLVGHTDWVCSVGFSPDGRFLASSSSDRTIRIWNATSSSESTAITQKIYNSTVYSTPVSLDGTFIVSGSFDHSVRVWDPLTGNEKLPPLLGHRGPVWSVAISPDSRLIASASVDKTVRLWNVRTGKPFGEPLQGHSDSIAAITFSPDARWIVSGSYDATVRIWDVLAWKPAPFGVLHCKGNVFGVSFSADGRLLAAGDGGGYIHTWWSSSYQPAHPSIQANHYGIGSVAFSPDATQIVSSGHDGLVSVWDVGSGHAVFMLRGHTEMVMAAAYSPNGLYIASAAFDETVRLWDAKTGEHIATLLGHGNLVHSVAFTPDGQTIVSGSFDRTIHLWDVEMACSPPLQADKSPLSRLKSAALDDGWLIGSSGELLLWLPSEYRGCLQLPPCTMIIGPHRILLTEDVSNGSRWGDQWSKCWHSVVHHAV